MGKKLYVGNLNYGVTDSDLSRMFEAHGTVESAQVIMDRDTGRSKGFGFVEMKTDQEAQAAIAALNGQDNGGRALTVNEAKPRTDTEKLQGTWEVLETTWDGETKPTPEGVDGRLVIKGDDFRLMFWTKGAFETDPKKREALRGQLTGGTLLFATFKLNTKTSPRNINLVISNDPEAHEVCLGIYKLDGDDLMICLPYLKPCERRPTEFTAGKGSDQQLYKLRRARPEKK